MSKTVGDLFDKGMSSRSFLPCDKIPHKGLVGIEVELEGMGYFYDYIEKGGIDLGFWRVITDGSLRDNGLEFVLSEPLSGHDLLETISLLDKTITDFSKGRGKPPSVSERTSTHVHVDVRDMNFNQLTHYIILFIVFERSFFKAFGDGGERANNNYCTPTHMSDKVQTLNTILTGGYGNKYDVINHSSKYSSLNLKAIHKLGSLEARLHEATWKGSELTLWVNVLLSLKTYCLENELSLTEFSSSISMEGFNTFISRLFNEDEAIIDKLTYPEMHTDILEGIRLAQDMLLYRDTSKIHIGLKKKSKAMKNRKPLEVPTLVEEYCLANEIDYEGDL